MIQTKNPTSQVMIARTADDVSFGGLNRKAEEIMNLIDDYDKKMLGYITELSKATSGKVISIDKVENIVQALQQQNAENEYEYLNCLLHPEKCKGVKIPSPIPVPSCAFQLHNTVTLSTNASGNLAFVFNPFFLYDTNLQGQSVPYISADDQEVSALFDYASSFYFCNDQYLDGHTEGIPTWQPINIGQGIPSVYNQYRLVSASLIVRYIGRMDITSGVIGGAIVYDESVYPGIKLKNNYNLSPFGNLAKYSNFDLAMDSFYHQETNCVNGLREIYFPLDNTYEEYTKNIANVTELAKDLNQHFTVIATPAAGTELGSLGATGFYGRGKHGFQQMVYVLGAPPSSACFKVDIYCNFETLPNAKFLNYMPISITPKTINPETKKETLAIVQRNPITDLRVKPKWYGSLKSGIFSGLKKVFNTGIPKLMLDSIAPKIVPFYKPALSLFNMFENNQKGNTDDSFQTQNPNVPAIMENDQNLDMVD